jgi:hypothetical protein
MQSERNFFAGVQRSAGKTGNLANGLLELGSGHRGLK